MGAFLAGLVGVAATGAAFVLGRRLGFGDGETQGLAHGERLGRERAFDEMEQLTPAAFDRWVCERQRARRGA